MIISAFETVRKVMVNFLVLWKVTLRDIIYLLILILYIYVYIYIIFYSLVLLSNIDVLWRLILGFIFFPYIMGYSILYIGQVSNRSKWKL